MGGEYLLLLVVVTSSFFVGSMLAGLFGRRVLQLQFKRVVAIALLSFVIILCGFGIMWFQGLSWAVWQFLLSLFIMQLFFQYVAKSEAFSLGKSIVNAIALALIPSTVIGLALYAF